MKTTKILSMAALALLTAACSSDDNELSLDPQPAGQEGIPFSATISMDNSATRGLIEGTGAIEASWESDEKVALIYEVSGTAYSTSASVYPKGDGTATITATLEAGTTDGTPVTIIYPSSAADGATGNVYSNLLKEQDGNLKLTANSVEKRCDVRKSSGATLKMVDDKFTLNGKVSLANQNAIFKFTLTGPTVNKTHPFIIKDAEGRVITTVTPPDYDDKTELFVAMAPAASSKYYFQVLSDDNNVYTLAGTATIEAGNYYQTPLTMTKSYPKAATAADPSDIGSVLANDGNIYLNATAAGTKAEALVAYTGNATGYFNYLLAIALEDASSTTYTWSESLTASNTYASLHPITIGGTPYNSSKTSTSYYDQVDQNQATSSATASSLTQGWRLPTVTDLRYIFDGLGRIKAGLDISLGKSSESVTPTSPAGISDGMYYTDRNIITSLRKAINDACDNTSLQSGSYWLSSEYSGNTNNAWRYRFDAGTFVWNLKSDDSYKSYARNVFAY